MKRHSLINFFYEKEAKHPNAPYLHQPFGDRWETYTWGEVGNMARRVANYLIQQGLPPGSKIGLISANCREWIIADLAIMMAKMVSVPFFPTLTGKQLAEVLELGDVDLLFVGKTKVWADMKTGIPESLKVIKFPHYEENDLIDIGTDWKDILSNTDPLQGTPSASVDDLWTIIFTSGTTGTPKGVMHDYNNVCEVIDFNLTYNPCKISPSGANRFLSYLPLNHIAERCFEMIGIALGAEVFFAESIDRFAENLKEARPNNFFAVPRIWTKFMQAILMQLPQKRLSLMLKTPVVRKLIQKKIATGLGLQNSVNNMSGAAPIPQPTKDWYASIGLPISEVYGMTENFGSCTFLDDNVFKPRSVGKANQPVQIKIDPESGEILMRAPWVMKGYYKSPELTAKTIVDGWLHTGDQGELDDDGFLYITGRVNDTFKTSKGEFVIPSALEDHFSSSEDIETMCLLGLGMPQPVLIVSLSEAGSSKSQSMLSESLRQTLTSVNQQLASYQRVNAIVIAKQPFSVEDGTLTPTLKVKRSRVHEVYKDRLHLYCCDEAEVIFE